MKSKQWSREEDAILRKFYPTEGIGVMSRLPGRSEIAIRQRATDAGVRMTHEALAASRSKKASRQANARAAASSKAPAVPVAAQTQAGFVQTVRREGAQPVPDSEIGMPWVKYPDTTADCRGIISRFTYLLDEFGLNMSPGERMFFESSRKYAQVKLQRLEARKPNVADPDSEC